MTDQPTDTRAYVALLPCGCIVGAVCAESSGDPLDVPPAGLVDGDGE